MDPGTISFQLDEHVPHAIAHALERRGIDAATAHSSGTIGMPDERLLAWCLSERRVLVTHDDDFLRLDSDGQMHAGIVYCAQERFSIGEIVEYLELVAKVLLPSEIAGRVEYVR